MAITPETLRLVAELRRTVDDITDNTVRELTRAWVRAWDAISADMSDAVADLVSGAVGGPWPSRAEIDRNQRLASALQAAADALTRLARQALHLISTAAADALRLAVEGQERIVTSQLPRQAQGIVWNRLDAAALGWMVERTTQRIHSRRWHLDGQAVQAMKTELVRGIAVGRNPREAARRMVRRVEGAFNGGLARAANIARTEVLDAHRAGAQAAQDANANALAGWVWLAQLTPRTCASCWAKHGNLYPLHVPGPLDHQSGRCSRMPKTRPWSELGFTGIDEPDDVVPDARAVFDALPHEDQVAILGPTRLRMLRDGEIDWADLSTRRVTDGWRDSYGATPVRDLEAGRRPSREDPYQPITPPTADTEPRGLRPVRVIYPEDFEFPDEDKLPPGGPPPDDVLWDDEEKLPRDRWVWPTRRSEPEPEPAAGAGGGGFAAPPSPPAAFPGDQPEPDDGDRPGDHEDFETDQSPAEPQPGGPPRVPVIYPEDVEFFDDTQPSRTGGSRLGVDGSGDGAAWPHRVTPSGRPDLGDLIPVDDPSEEELRAIQDLVRSTLDGREFAGLRIDLKQIDPIPGALFIVGTIEARDGRAGSFERHFHRDPDGELWARHEYLSLNDEYQGRGFASEFNGFLYDWYRESGFSRVEVHANIDVGGYTWAAQGFDFESENDARHVLERLRAEINKTEQELNRNRDRLPMSQVQQVQAEIDAAREILDRAEASAFGSDDYPSAFEISQVGRRPGATSWIGQRAMLGSNWHGVLHLPPLGSAQDGDSDREDRTGRDHASVPEPRRDTPAQPDSGTAPLLPYGLTPSGLPDLAEVVPREDEIDGGQLAAIQDAIRDGTEGTFASLTTRATGIAAGRDWAAVDGEIHDAAGNTIGYFSWRFARDEAGELYAELELLELAHHVRGQGFGTAYTQHVYRWLRESGARRVELTANIDVGGYTWASAGYDFVDELDARDILDRLERETEQLEDRLRVGRARGDLSPEEIELLESEIRAARELLERAEASAFGSDDYPSAFEISQVGRRPGAIDWVGRRAMLGSTWAGVLWLGDPGRPSQEHGAHVGADRGAGDGADAAPGSTAPEAGPDGTPEGGEPERGTTLPGLGELIPGDHVTDLDRYEAIQEAIRAGLEGTYAGLQVRVSNIGIGRGWIKADGDIIDPSTGLSVGRFERLFARDDDGYLYAEHQFLTLQPQVRGRGFATEFNNHLYRWYIQSGFDRVETYADIDVGGYTWATQGFDFRDELNAMGILQRLELQADLLEDRLVQARHTGADPSVIEAMEEELRAAREILERAETSQFGDDDYPSAFEISQVGRRPGQSARDDTWIGKRAMLGSAWEGVLWLNREGRGGGR